MQLFDELQGVIGALGEGIPVIDASTIAEHLDQLEDGPGEDAGWPSAAYGIVAPPFPQFFIEATVAIDGNRVRRGVLCASFDVDSTAPPGHVPPGTRWTLVMDGFLSTKIQGKDQGISSYAGTAVIYIDSRGHLITDMATGVSVVTLPNHPTFPKVRQLPAEALAPHCVYALKAISALHQSCPVEEVKLIRQERRSIERATGYKGTDYYVLKVRSGAPGRFEDIGRSPTSGTTRHHIVRGHFKYYFPDKPLFGQPGRHGAIWVPEHGRGDDSIGEIQKDYEV